MVYAQPRIRPKNETHKILSDFQIQMDHLISARTPDLIIVNKKEKLLNSRLCRFSWRQGQTTGKRKERPC